MHSFVPELASSVGSPRVVGIGYPGSVPFGVAGDAQGQRAVLKASLETAVEIGRPGRRIDLPFEWPPEKRLPKPPQPPPIARAIMKRPWLFLDLLNGRIP